MSTETTAPRPFLKWAGGKRQLLSEIGKRLPENLEEYDTYVEPFIGGGAEMFHLLHNHNFERVMALDINAELILCNKTSNPGDDMRTIHYRVFSHVGPNLPTDDEYRTLELTE